MGDDEILQLFYHRVEYAISAVEEKYGRLCRSVARGILKDERDVEELSLIHICGNPVLIGFSRHLLLG